MGVFSYSYTRYARGFDASGTDISANEVSQRKILRGIQFKGSQKPANHECLPYARAAPNLNSQNYVPPREHLNAIGYSLVYRQYLWIRRVQTKVCSMGPTGIPGRDQKSRPTTKALRMRAQRPTSTPRTMYHLGNTLMQ